MRNAHPCVVSCHQETLNSQPLLSETLTFEASGGLWRSLEASGGLWRPLEASGGLWRLLEASGGLWKPLEA